jgi:hypothetical protein
VATLLWGSRPAPAYFPVLDNSGNPIRWKAGSPTTIWDNTTQTVSWAFYTGNFPQGSWPTASQAGAAFQNAWQSLNDAAGTGLNFNRLPDTTTTPSKLDGNLTFAFVLNEKSDFYGTDLTGANGITYVMWDTTNGFLQDADIFINADPTSGLPPWSTTGAPNTRDLQATATHESMHATGAAHDPYFNSRVFPVARAPVVFLQDNCLAPDDRAFFQSVYPPGAAANGTLNGSVNLSGGGPADRAVVVATDANGVPQAITATKADGTFAGLNVPVGSYTLTVFHGRNSSYFPTFIPYDIDFVNPTPASPFTHATTVGPVAVTAGANVGAPAITADNTGGAVPTMTLSFQSISPFAPPGFQTLFLSSNPADPSHAGSLIFEIDKPAGNVSAASITSVSLGNDITVGAPITATNVGPNTTDITVPYTVSATARPGTRNLSIVTNVNNNEALFLPGVIKIVCPGGLTVGPSSGNPASGGVTPGQKDVPLLGITFLASAPLGGNTEDVRIRRLAFNIAGSGPAPLAFRLWIDNGVVGTLLAPPDVRIFSGGAYATNPISETITITPAPGTPPGSVIFDDLALSIPAGQMVNLLLTADMPMAGSGSYTASLDPAGTDATGGPNLVSHGMWWGDSITPTGGTVTGGTESMGALVLDNLTQIRTTAGTIIPVGGTTNETQVTLKGTPSSAFENVGMDVEVKPLGTAFTNTPSAGGSVAPTNPSGTQLGVTITGLADLTSYHWHARPVGSVSGPGAWVSFGANSEAAVDFSVDTTTTNPPTALAQFQADGVTSVPLGGSTRGSIILQATTGTNSGGQQVRLEVEVQPATTPFTNLPNAASPFVVGGAVAVVSFAGATSDYHWQARCADAFGSDSTWVAFNAATIHFHLDAIQEIKATAGCIARTAVGGGGLLWAVAGVTLLALAFTPRAARKAAAILVCLVSLPAAASAADDLSLPRTLADSLPAPVFREAEREEEPLFRALPAPRAASDSWISLDAYLGFLFMDMKFNAVGTDFVQREVKGTGTAVLGVEALVNPFPDWRVGVDAEVGYWSNVRILAAGPAVTWRFASSRIGYESGRSETEHYLKLVVLYEKLTVTKQNFGSFDSTFGVRAGYEARLSIGKSWAVTLGADVLYSKWKYSPAVQSGDTSIGGFGGIITVGFAYLP